METPVTENDLLFGWLFPLSTHCFVFSSVQPCLEQVPVSKGREGGEGQAPDLQEASRWFLGPPGRRLSFSSCRQMLWELMAQFQ